MARPCYSSRPRVHTVWHSPKRNSALMLAEIRDHADRGELVQIVRPGGCSFQIVKNGLRYFARSAAGDPLATVDTVLEAVLVGDRHLEYLPRVDGDDFPRGAA